MLHPDSGEIVKVLPLNSECHHIHLWDAARYPPVTSSCGLPLPHEGQSIQARHTGDSRKIISNNRTGRGSRRISFQATMLIDSILRAGDTAYDRFTSPVRGRTWHIAG